MAMRLMIILLKDVNLNESDKQFAKDRVRDLFGIILDCFTGLEGSYNKRKLKEEVKLKDSLTKFKDVISFLNDLTKSFSTMFTQEIETILRKQIEIMGNMKTYFKSIIKLREPNNLKEEPYDQAHIEQFINYLFIIRFLIEMELPGQTPRELKDASFKDIICPHNQLLFKRIIFIVKLNVQYDEVKEHSFICLNRILSTSNNEFNALIIKKFKVLFEEKIFIGEGIRSLVTINKGYNIIITLINRGKMEGLFTRENSNNIDYVKYLVIKLLNIIQNNSASTNDTTKKAVETLSEFIEGMNSENDKDILLSVIESFANQFETLRKKCRLIFTYLKQSEARRKELVEYDNTIFRNHIKKINTEVPKPSQPNLFEENIILSGNSGMFSEWETLEDFTQKLNVILKLIIGCITITIAKIGNLKSLLDVSDMRPLIKLFIKGSRLLGDIRIQLSNDISDIESEVYEIFKNFICTFLKLPLQSFTKLYSEVAGKILQQYLLVPYPMNNYMLNVTVRLRDEKKMEKSLDYTIRYSCCIFNQLIKDYSVIVKTIEARDFREQTIITNLVKYCSTSFDRLAPLREKCLDFVQYVVSQLAKMFILNAIKLSNSLT